jgi:hypothetical protein
MKDIGSEKTSFDGIFNILGIFLSRIRISNTLGLLYWLQIQSVLSALAHQDCSVEMKFMDRNFWVLIVDRHGPAY